MLASLLRPRAKRAQIDQSAFSSPFTSDNSPWFRGNTQRVPRETRGADSSDDEPELEDIHEHWEREDEEEGEEDEPIESTPLLPIFSSSHLGIYGRPVLNAHGYYQFIWLTAQFTYRCPPRLRYHPCHSPPNRRTM